MTQLSRFWNGVAIGDAAVEAPYDANTEFSKVLMALCGADADTNKGGVVTNALSELAPTAPGGTTVRIASGCAFVWGSWYENDGDVDTSPTAPVASTRIDRYVLRKDWAAQTVRITRIAGVEGGAAPALVQSVGTTWDYPICQASTTTGGAVTITDQRTFLMFNPMTTAADSIVGGTSGVPTRLAKGTALQIKRMNAGATAQEWGAVDVTMLPTSVVTAPDNASTKIVHGAASTAAIAAVDKPIYRGADNSQVFGETFSVAPFVGMGTSTNGNQFWNSSYSNSTTGVVTAVASVDSGATPAGIRWIAIGS